LANKDKMEGIVDDFLSILPLMRRSISKKVLKSALEQIEEPVSLPQFEIMKTLQEEGIQHIAWIGEKLSIPKPQMTVLIDRLVSLGIVERQADVSDRRVINIALTPRGKTMIDEHDGMVRDIIIDKLSCLTDREVMELTDSLRKLNRILFKLQ
jgi:DNA-binding MarR family transcriptional regulator